MFWIKRKLLLWSTSTGVGGKTDFHEHIKSSCFREVLEETGLKVTNMRLKGILKTILDGGSSSWLLFAYSAEKPESEVTECDEGELSWVPIEELYSHNLVDFIRKVLPHILDEHAFFEGTLIHDSFGDVLKEEMSVYTTSF